MRSQSEDCHFRRWGLRRGLGEGGRWEAGKGGLDVLLLHFFFTGRHVGLK